METFDLELRLTRFGSIISETVFLEDATDPSMEVKGWLSGADYRFVQLPGYSIADSTLEIFLACRGIAGGSSTCEVLINNHSAGKLTAKAEDTKYVSKSFKIKKSA